MTCFEFLWQACYTLEHSLPRSIYAMHPVVLWAASASAQSPGMMVRSWIASDLPFPHASVLSMQQTEPNGLA